MSLTVWEVKAWLAGLRDDDAIGIDEDGWNLRLADDRYDEAALEIGMALSSAFLEADEKAKNIEGGRW